MALLPPPDIGAAYVDESNRPSKDFYNWIKSLYDYTRSITLSGGGTVSSVSSPDISLTIAPTTGIVTATMNMAHANTWTTTQTFRLVQFTAGDDFGINDRSSVLSNGSTFWDNNMHRMNRLFVGIAATVDGNNVPQTPTVLSSTYNFAWTQNSQLGVMSSMGLNAITGTSRASDWVAFSGTASQGSQALTGFGFNDDTTTAGGSIAVGANLIGVATPGSKGITLGTQNDVNSARTPVTIDPFTGFTAGTTIATLSTAGAFTSAATQDCSAAYVVGQGNGGTLFNAGLVFMASSLTQPGGAAGTAVALPQNYALVWYSAAGVKSGSIYVDGSGNMNINCAGVVKINGVTLTVP